MTARDLAWPVVGAGIGLAAGGLLGLLAGAVVAAGIVWRPDGVMVAAMSTSLALAVVTLLEESPDAATTRVFPTLRPVAHQVGLVSALVWVAAGVVVLREVGHPAGPEVGAPAGKRAMWPLAILVSVAVMGTLVLID